MIKSKYNVPKYIEISKYQKNSRMSAWFYTIS